MKLTVSFFNSAALLIGFLLLSAGCRPRYESANAGQLPPATVRVQTIGLKNYVATEEVVGTVRAKLHASIEAKASGRIEKMLGVPGQSVKAGELLVQLDAREIQARLEQGVAQRDQYARDTERLRRLLAQNAVSRQEFETDESHYRVAVATVIESETLLGYTKVTAPFAGVITRKLVDVGDLASPGRLLLEMEDPTVFRLEADVPEALIARVELGATLVVRVPSATTELPGTVSEIAPSADSGSRTFLVKLDLPQAPGVRAGQFGRVAIPLGENAALRMPASAVVQRGQMEIVFVEANQQAQMRLVKTGKRLGSDVELVSGIEAGERVVVEGTSLLRDGQPLEVRQ